MGVIFVVLYLKALTLLYNSLCFLLMMNKNISNLSKCHRYKVKINIKYILKFKNFKNCFLKNCLNYCQHFSNEQRKKKKRLAAAY